MNRRNQILTGVLVLQLVLMVIVFWPRQATTATKGQALFPGISADQITEVRLTNGQGEEVRLAKKGSDWVLPDAGDYPAVTSTVSSLLNKIVKLTAERLVAQNSTSYKRLKVADDDFSARVDLSLADGSQHKLYVGNSSGYDSAYVRADNQEKVYQVSGVSSSNVSSKATAWIDPVYFKVGQEEVTALTLENANGRFEFVKDQAGAWTMSGLAAGETLDQEAVKSLLSSVSSVSMLKPLEKEDKAEYGLDAPVAVVTIKTHSEAEGDKSYTLRVGAQDAADKSYVLASSSSPYYVRVNSYTVSSWIEKGRDGFLKVPPTPTP